MEKLTIVKVAGRIVEEQQSREQLLNNVAKIVGNKLLVQGGGFLAEKLASKMGVDIQKVENQLMVTQEILEVLMMGYAGLINKQIVALLQAKDINAIGLTGCDLNLLEAFPGKETHLGKTGEIAHVNTSELRLLLNAGAVPVVAPLAHDSKGNILSVKADSVASKLAVELSRFYDVNLYYCFDTSGVLMNPEDVNSVIPELNYTEFSRMQEENLLTAKMIHKLNEGYRALSSGVKQVLITSPSQLIFAKGTRLSLQKEF